MSLGDLSRINSNVQSLQSLGSFNKTNDMLGMRQLRLATGSRLNSAEDDSAGYSIAKKLESRVRGQAQAIANIGDAKSMLTIGEGALTTTMDILQTMKEKAVQAANDTLGTAERDAIQSQLDALVSEVTDTLDTAKFNGKEIFSSDANQSFSFQVGDSSSDSFGVALDKISKSTMLEASVGVDSSLWDGGAISSVTDTASGANTYDVRTATTAADGSLAGAVWGDDTPGAGGGDETAALSAFGVDKTDADFEDTFGAADEVQFQTATGTNSDLKLQYSVDGGANWIDAGIDDNDFSADVDVSIDGLTFTVAGNDDVEAGDGFSVSLTDSVEVSSDGGETYSAATQNGNSFTSNSLTFTVAGSDFDRYGEFSIGTSEEGSLNVDSNATAKASIESIDGAIGELSSYLAGIGDAQSRLSIKQDNLNTSMTNNEAARSRIEDADFAREQMEIVKLQILQQTGISSLAQANSAPQAVLSLL